MALPRIAPPAFRLFAAVGLMCLLFLAYGPALRGDFLWDDDAYVQNNQTLRSFDGLRRIWSDPLATPQYYPLVHTTYWVEYQLWGLWTPGYHGVNVLLHGWSALLLGGLLVRLGIPGAWCAAAFFAFHPVHVESVAWITERKNVLCGLFYLLSLRACVPCWELDCVARPLRERQRNYVIALALFGGALLAKTVACTLPAAVAILLWWRRGRVERKDWLSLAPFFLVGAVLGLNTAWLEHHHVGARGDAFALSLMERGLVAGRAIWFYLGKLVWPLDLAFFYPRWDVDSGVAWQYLFPVAGFLVLMVLWGLRGQWGRGMAAGMFYFVLTLGPALGFISVYPMRYAYVADHFQYLASIGPLVLAAALLARLPSGWKRRGVQVLLCALLLTLTWQQSHDYRDLETLWNATLRKSPQAWGAHANLANLYARQERYEEAFPHYRQAILTGGHAPEPWHNLGTVLSRLGRLEEAERCFREALRIAPEDTFALNGMGVIRHKTGRYGEAMAYYEQILAIHPASRTARENWEKARRMQTGASSGIP